MAQKTIKFLLYNDKWLKLTFDGSLILIYLHKTTINFHKIFIKKHLLMKYVNIYAGLFARNKEPEQIFDATNITFLEVR